MYDTKWSKEYLASKGNAKQVEEKEESCLEYDELPTNLKQLDSLLDEYAVKIAGWKLSKDFVMSESGYPYCVTDKSGQEALHDDLGNAILYLLSCAGCFVRR